MNIHPRWMHVTQQTVLVHLLITTHFWQQHSMLSSGQISLWQVQEQQLLKPSYHLRLKQSKTEWTALLSPPEMKGKVAGQQQPCNLRGYYIRFRRAKESCTALCLNSQWLTEKLLSPTPRQIHIFKLRVWGFSALLLGLREKLVLNFRWKIWLTKLIPTKEGGLSVSILSRHLGFF